MILLPASRAGVRTCPAGGAQAVPGRAFTVLELLVVIAVITALAALLSAGARRCKDSAQRVQCVGHLRQLAVATQLYWDDNEGRAFRYRLGPTNGGELYWFGWLAAGDEGGRRFRREDGVLAAYLGSGGVEICPSLRYDAAEFKRKAAGASYGYGYNLGLSAPMRLPPVDMGQVRDPAGVVVFADAAQVNTFQAPASPEHPMLEEFYYISTNEPTVHFRHAATANAAFGDGHVGWQSPEPGSLDPRLPRHRVGRLTAGILIPK